MSRAIVTRAKNVVYGPDNSPIIDDEGNVSLHDDSIVGYVGTTHVLNISKVDEEKQVLQQGFVPRAEVYWEHQRSPAPAMEDPADLFFIGFTDDEDYVDEDDDEGEEGQEETW